MTLMSLRAMVMRVIHPSVDDCVTLFEKAKQKLVKVQFRHMESAASKREFADKLQDEADGHEDEVNRAYRIITKLNEFTE